MHGNKVLYRDRYYSVAELAKMFGVSRQTIYTRLKNWDTPEKVKAPRKERSKELKPRKRKKIIYNGKEMDAILVAEKTGIHSSVIYKLAQNNNGVVKKSDLPSPRFSLKIPNKLRVKINNLSPESLKQLNSIVTMTLKTFTDAVSRDSSEKSEN